MKMNKKGFTLVELLAVMVILITISLVSVSAVTESLTRREVKECVEQQELAVGAAKIYFSLVNDDTKDDSVTIGELKASGYVTEGDKTSILKDSDIITISYDKYLYNGKVIGESCS